MNTLSTPAIVLRRVDYRDYDRMVSLFSPALGRIDAVARGCRRPKSPLLNAVEPFVLGTYQLRCVKERYTIEQCEITEGYYALRMDYDRLVHGSYWLRLLEAAVQPEAEAQQLFHITARALAYLCYSELPPELLTMGFEMHFMAQLGFAPRMNLCMECGRAIDGPARFNISAGGVLCMHHPSAAPKITDGARRIMMKLPRTAYDKIDLVESHPNWKEAAAIYRRYINDRMHMERFAPPLPES